MAVQHSWFAVFDELSLRKFFVPIAVTLLAFLLQLRVIGWASTKENIQIVFTSVAAGICVFGVFVILHLVRKPCELQIAAQGEIARISAENANLRRPSSDDLLLAEEDPKIYVKAKTLITGVKLEVANEGQRQPSTRHHGTANCGTSISVF
jgi:hypothetical protein